MVWILYFYQKIETMKIRFLIIVLFLVKLNSEAQNTYKAIAPPEYIKTIILNEDNDPDKVLVAKLGTKIHLSFDDLAKEEKTYYYKINYYNSDWTASTLFDSEYITGFVSDEIYDYEYSYNTIQSYVHYTLELPNDMTTLTKSGNYSVTVFEEDNEDNPIFSRRFMLYEDRVVVGGAIKRSNRQLFEDQNVNVVINYMGFKMANPMERIKLSVMQNNDWSTLRTNIKPLFIRENQLLYQNMPILDFKGGNEFYYFENKDYQLNTNYIAHVRQDDESGIYHHFLYVNMGRKNQPYTYFPDIDGGFKITSSTADDVSIEAEYVYVHFSLGKGAINPNETVFVYGAFNDYALNQSNAMKYNPQTKQYECIILLKQGFYNYNYVSVSNNTLDRTSISGSHYQTENNYLLLVYYREFGQDYDRLIGVGQAK